MLEIKYLPDGGQQKVDTPPLADGATQSVHFKTPTLKNHGNGGIVQLANDLNTTGTPNNSTIEWAISKTTGDFTGKKTITGPNSGSTGFNSYPLDSGTDYYVNLKSIGASPNGVRVKVTAGTERTGR